MLYKCVFLLMSCLLVFYFFGSVCNFRWISFFVSTSLFLWFILRTLRRQSPLTCIASSSLNSSSAPHTRYCFCVVFIMILSLANVCSLHSFIKFYVVDVIVVGTS
mmetsp:Transcript_28570/g.31215  ORF Transcript_28570/g.31215 Transcript_28570/m.31215 type:complete len:105 (-) Transcript_28570:1445-1759(-)